MIVLHIFYNKPVLESTSHILSRLFRIIELEVIQVIILDNMK